MKAGTGAEGGRVRRSRVCSALWPLYLYLPAHNERFTASARSKRAYVRPHLSCIVSASSMTPMLLSLSFLDGPWSLRLLRCPSFASSRGRVRVSASPRMLPNNADQLRCRSLAALGSPEGEIAEVESPRPLLGYPLTSPVLDPFHRREQKMS